jgi:imidazolonepropionase
MSEQRTANSGQPEARGVTPLLLRNIGSLVTNAADAPGDLGVVEDAAVAIRDGLVVWAGPDDDVPVALLRSPLLDAGGRCVIPGFVDSHTHLVFAGDRSDEFAARLEGASYETILAAGGGIHATVSATRAASDDVLLRESAARAARMLRTGTTTVEIKSGYGLTTADEVRMLEVARRVGEETGIGVVRTFLGAHVPDREVPEDEYVALVVEEMLPAAAPHAEFCDVFVERGAFSVESARRIVAAASARGLVARFHAEQLTHSGAAALAAEVGAASADHLDHVTPHDARLLAESGVVAGVLPGVALSMRIPQVPARMLWDAGVIVALATDCNPGTSYVESMQLMVALAGLEMCLTTDEAVWAATRGGARSLQREDLGIIRPGAAADLVVLDAPTHHHLVYRPGTDLAWKVVKAGHEVGV